MAGAGPGSDPLAQLVEEHRVFRERTRSFSETVGRYEALVGTVPLDAAMVEEFATFLSEDVDRRHGAKEEEALFPAIERHGSVQGGPVSVMLQEHEDLRGHQRTLIGAARRLSSDAEEPDAQRTVLSSAGEVHQLLGSHIEKEESVLFPMAREMLSPQEISSIQEAFHLLDEKMGPISRTPTSGPGSGSGKLPPFCAAGRARQDRAGRS